MDPLEEFDIYYTKALKFLSYRPRSTKELRDNLLRKKADPDITEGVIVLLTKQKFLNDREFAKWWIRQRKDFRPKSISIIKLELFQRGISKEAVTEILDKAEGDEKVDEVDMARRLIEKKVMKYKQIDKKIAYQKLGNFLARKGFNWDIISRVIDEAYK